MTAAAIRQRIGRIGIWSLQLRFGDPAQAVDAAAELDALGYGAIWIPGGVGGPVLADVSRLLDATSRITIATGIINIWKHEPAEIGDWWAGLPGAQRHRVLLGLGISHGPLIGESYAKPVATMRDYLGRVREAGMAADHLCLAALGPKMLELSRDETAGAHPYLITPEHTAEARHILGSDALLAPEMGVVLETDPDRAREIARGALEHYRRLPNYVNSWLRLGFTPEEIDGASDRLIDALFAWGSIETIADRLAQHHAAGADHVCLQVLNGQTGADAGGFLPAWRELAGLI